MIFLCLPLRFEACYENFPNFEKLISTEGDAVNDYIINISCIRSFFCSYSPEQVQRQPPRVVLRNFEEISHFTGKHLCQSLPFNKIAGLTPATLLKKKLWHRYFPVNFAKFLKENVRNFQKLMTIILIKYYFEQRSFCLRILFFMFSSNFIFVVSHLKIYPAI